MRNYTAQLVQEVDDCNHINFVRRNSKGREILPQMAIIDKHDKWSIMSEETSSIRGETFLGETLSALCHRPMSCSFVRLFVTQISRLGAVFGFAAQTDSRTAKQLVR